MRVDSDFNLTVKPHEHEHRHHDRRRYYSSFGPQHRVHTSGVAG
jgi:hypothetical protein